MSYQFSNQEKNQTTNYRLINGLPISAKTFEKIAHKKMISFTDIFNLLSTNQFGFLARQDTSDFLTEYLDKTYDAIDQNRVFQTIFLDVFKAFHIVNLEILLKKQYYSSLD